jgi:hypothetical protein
MNMVSCIVTALLFGIILGCAGMGDDLNSITAFNPYITKDGKQSFRFVAKKNLPSFYKNADVQSTHEAWISNELGKRQYCMKGYEIVSTTEVEDNIIYEGVCR